MRLASLGAPGTSDAEITAHALGCVDGAIVECYDCDYSTLAETLPAGRGHLCAQAGIAERTIW